MKLDQYYEYLVSQHCGYWWSGALAPGHQKLQCWASNHAFPAIYGLAHGGAGQSADTDNTG